MSDELKPTATILADHKKYLAGEAGGKRADLRSADLRSADLKDLVNGALAQTEIFASRGGSDRLEEVPGWGGGQAEGA